MTTTTGAAARSKSKQAYDHLRRAIVEQSFAPGHRLVLQPIADELGMSVVPVREAVRQLEAEGLVTFERNVGARVALRDERTYLQVMQLLAVIEGAATALAVGSLTPDDIAQARHLNDRMRAQLDRFDPHGFTRLNREFHEVLFSRCPNAALRDEVAGQWERLDYLRTSTFSFIPGRSPKSVAEHEALLALIEEGAPLRDVEAAARAHRTTTIEAYLAESPTITAYVHI